MRALVLACVLAGGCTVAEVDVTVNIPAGVPLGDARLALDVSGDDHYASTIPISPPAVGTQARFVYRTHVTGGIIDVAVTIEDSHGACLAYGRTAGIVLRENHAMSATVDVAAADCPSPPPDLGTPDLTTSFGPDLAGSDGGVPSKCPGTFLVCDGFEAAGIDNILWKTSTSAYESVTPDTTRAYRGAQSLLLHVKVPSGTGSVTVDPLITWTGQSDNLYARAFVYIPSTVPFSKFLSDANLMQTRQTGLQGYGASLLTDGAHLGSFDFAAMPNRQAISGTTFPLDRWVCIEWRVHNVPAGDGGTGELRVWQDGFELTDAHLGSFGLNPPLGQFSFGFYAQVMAGVTFDVWMDEVVLDTSPVGCSK